MTFACRNEYDYGENGLGIESKTKLEHWKGDRELRVKVIIQAKAELGKSMGRDWGRELESRRHP